MRSAYVPLLLGLASVSWAQGPASLDGNWTAKWSTDKGVPAQADVVIKGQEGTWHRLGGDPRSDPCVFRQTPLAVRSVTQDEVVVEVLRAKMLQGCEDATFTFRRVDDKTLERTMNSGGTMRVTR